MRFLLLVMMVILSCHLFASEEKQNEEQETWWEKRHQRPDIYFPHNAHMDVMSQSADVCMACHPFSSNIITNLEQLESVQVIYNEPLEAICHSCHLEARSAPMACQVCHVDGKTIRPSDHKGDYTWFHTETARSDEKSCLKCHVDLNFCTDCHFRRNPSRQVMHPLGYRDRHGIEARINASSCAACHQPGYCRNCHAGRYR
jgi:hypothetical protein